MHLTVHHTSLRSLLPLHTPEPPSPFPTLRAQWNILNHCLRTFPQGPFLGANAADTKWLSTLDRSILTAVAKKRAEPALLEAEAHHAGTSATLQPLPLKIAGKVIIRHDSLAERSSHDEAYTYSLQPSPALQYISAPWPTPATATFAKEARSSHAASPDNSSTPAEARNSLSIIESSVHFSGSGDTDDQAPLHTI